MKFLPRIKKNIRWDGDQKILRLVKFIWVNGSVGDGQGYSAKLTLSVQPKIMHLKKGYEDVEITILGIRISYVKSYGGVIQ